MAQLLLITEKTETPDQDIIDDIVGIFDDNHKFSERELEIFSVLKVNSSASEINAKLKPYKVERRCVYLSMGSSEWSFELLEDNLSVKDVWKNSIDGKWYFLENEPTHFHTIKDLTIEDRSNLNIDAPDILYEKMVKKIELLSENIIEAPIKVSIEVGDIR